MSSPTTFVMHIYSSGGTAGMTCEMMQHDSFVPMNAGRM